MKPFRIVSDPDILKPIIEAMIFASEEPLSAKGLIRLLVGDRDADRDDADTPSLLDEVETTSDLVDDAEVDDAPVGDADTEVSTAIEEVEGDVPDQESDSHGEEESADDLAQAMGRVAGKRRSRKDAIDLALVRAMVEDLNSDYEESGRAFRIVEVAGGYQFATIRDYGEFVAMLSKEKSRRRLSPAALETLAIIAYRQPVSKPEVESIRGVNCDQVLVNLMEKNLVAITGRSEAVGRPLLYSSTDEFLRTFGLKGIGDLPKLREIEELMETDAYSAERAEVIMINADTEVEEIEARVGAAGYDSSGEDADEPGGYGAEEEMIDEEEAGILAAVHHGDTENSDDDRENTMD